MRKYLISLWVVALIGCATTMGTFNNLAGKFLATTAATVDASMHAWATWVVAGKATPQDEAQVRAIYATYQGDMMVATNAYALAVKVGDPTLFAPASNKLFMTRTALTTITLKGTP